MRTPGAAVHKTTAAVGPSIEAAALTAAVAPKFHQPETAATAGQTVEASALSDARQGTAREPVPGRAERRAGDPQWAVNGGPINNPPTDACDRGFAVCRARGVAALPAAGAHGQVCVSAGRSATFGGACGRSACDA